MFNNHADATEVIENQKPAVRQTGLKLCLVVSNSLFLRNPLPGQKVNHDHETVGIGFRKIDLW